ncbi:unnamed protein product, partial [Meganyctiphanes norvegica]
AIKFTRELYCLANPDNIILNPGEEIRITTPGYKTYSAVTAGNREYNTSCDWNFKAKPDSGNITITCPDLYLHSSPDGGCADWLALGNKKYCGRNDPIGVTLGTEVEVRLRTHSKYDTHGFSCTAFLHTEPLAPQIKSVKKKLSRWND